MRKYATNGWIRPDDFVQIYSPVFGWEVERWLHLRCQISKYLSQVSPKVFKYCLLAILRNPYDVILAFPHRVA